MCAYIIFLKMIEMIYDRWREVRLRPSPAARSLPGFRNVKLLFMRHEIFGSLRLTLPGEMDPIEVESCHKIRQKASTHVSSMQVMRLFGNRAISTTFETPGFASLLYSRFAFSKPD